MVGKIEKLAPLFNTLKAPSIPVDLGRIEREESLIERAASSPLDLPALILSWMSASLFKGKIYVAHLLTSEEKLRRDKEKYNVNKSNGDRISYVHFTRPHFNILGREIEFNINAKNWQLNLMKRMKFLRGLKRWHKPERIFRDWYISEVVDKFDYSDEGSYFDYAKALQTPEQVEGYQVSEDGRGEKGG